MKRMEGLEIIAELGADLPITATCAATSRELAAIDDRPNHFYLLDSMGLTTSVGTGIAMAIEGSAVSRSIVIDGDGSLLMNLGALSTAGFLAPEKLLVVLLDNGVYASTAGLATHATRIDLGEVAQACGLRVTRTDTVDGLRDLMAAELTQSGPALIHARTEPGNTPGTSLLLIDPVVHGARFSAWLTQRMDK